MVIWYRVVVALLVATLASSMADRSQTKVDDATILQFGTLD